jgi:hypothetical protein
MRNVIGAIVNWVAALFAANGGAPHPMVATDPSGPARTPRRSKRRRR